MVKHLSIAEVGQVVADLDVRGWSDDARLNRVVFYLATFAGLRASEICDLTVGDVASDCIYVADGKGGKARTVPLWHAPARTVLSAWRGNRALAEPFIASRTGKRMTRQGVRKRYLTACKCLNRDLTIHHGRHTYLSLCLAKGIPIAAVRDAAGHSSIATTNIYAHTLDGIPACNLLAR